MKGVFPYLRTLPGLVLSIALSAALLQAQDARAIIEDSIRAVGGKKAIAGVRNIRGIAHCTGPNGKYTTEIYSATGQRLIFRQIRAGNIYTGHTNGGAFWTKDEKTGDFSPAGTSEAFAWRSHDYQMLAMDPAARFRDPVFEAEETFAGAAANKLRATDELGKPAYLFFDKNTKLMLGFTIQNPFSTNPETIRTVFNEWKQAGSLKLPSKVTASDKKGDFVLNFTGISLNKIDEKVFLVPQKVAAINELLVLHNQARAAHFNRDPELLVSDFADDYTFIGGGKIQQPAREASIARFRSYFNNSTFLEWDDITPPVIKISDDATMAYVTVHKKVKLLARDEKGAEHEETEIYAWLATYRKIGGKWKLTMIASTNTPEADR
jgi:hydrogenase maturation factor